MTQGVSGTASINLGIRLPGARVGDAQTVLTQGSVAYLERATSPRARRPPSAHAERLTEPRLGGINVPADEPGMDELQSL